MTKEQTMVVEENAKADELANEGKVANEEVCLRWQYKQLQTQHLVRKCKIMAEEDARSHMNQFRKQVHQNQSGECRDDKEVCEVRWDEETKEAVL